MKFVISTVPAWIVAGCVVTAAEPETRPRARDLGLRVGTLAAGAHNAITDVPGVRVGHVTIREGESIRTGLTAVVPHDGDLFRDKVTAAFDCFNGFGKPFGTIQIQELGEIETPILLTSTLAVPRVADAVISYALENDKSGEIRSVNPVVGETNDGYLSDGRARPFRPEHVFRAIRGATSGTVTEGAVGAGTGTRCLGYKGGIGTSSRRVATQSRHHVVGVLVQTNFGGRLRILGRPFPPASATLEAPGARDDGGSCAIVVATDAPLDARQLRRLARRAFAGMARTGASFSHSSGDYAFAFSTTRRAGAFTAGIADSDLSSFLLAAAEATEEAIYNSLLRAVDVRGRNGHEAKAIEIDRVRAEFDPR